MTGVEHRPAGALKLVEARENMTAVVNKFLLDVFFVQVLHYAIDQTHNKPEDLQDNELAFYKIERIGFLTGTRLLSKYCFP